MATYVIPMCIILLQKAHIKQIYLGHLVPVHTWH